jgi:excinuclease ABC subunit A
MLVKKGQFSDDRLFFSQIKHIEYVDQNPIGRSSRSNPVTYIKAYDDIRELYAKEIVKIRGYLRNTFLSMWMVADAKPVKEKVPSM